MLIKYSDYFILWGKRYDKNKTPFLDKNTPVYVDHVESYINIVYTHKEQKFQPLCKDQIFNNGFHQHEKYFHTFKNHCPPLLKNHIWNINRYWHVEISNQQTFISYEYFVHKIHCMIVHLMKNHAYDTFELIQKLNSK